MEPKERVVRELYEARARRDWSAVRPLLAEDVVWHEPGDEDYSGDYRGRAYDQDALSAVFAYD